MNFEQLKQQQHEAHQQGDFRLVWVCQQKIDYLKRENNKKMKDVKLKLECEGNCMGTHGTHHVEVKKVKVYGNGTPPVIFNYCKNAIKEDVRRGFFIEILE